MDKQGHTSKNLIDRRAATTHSVAVAIGLVFGLFARPSSHDQDRDRDLVQVVSTALDRGQAFWAGRIANYRDAQVVIFTSRIDTPCGAADEMTGPFYCPPDEKIYLDPTFLRAIQGDYARAYVIAHELGHHVQKLTGATTPGVALELQADCYAGTWMANEQRAGKLASSDVDDALYEAALVGDRGTIDTWTHGDAAARVGAVQRGLAHGACTL